MRPIIAVYSRFRDICIYIYVYILYIHICIYIYIYIHSYIERESVKMAVPRLGERLPLLEAHDSLCLLRNAFAIPKVLYILRTASCFLSPSLDRFDSLQRVLIESICNIQLRDASWRQASLPINGGGLGISSAAMLVPSAYLASAAGSAPISQAILPAGMTPSLPSIQAQTLVK